MRFLKIKTSTKIVIKFILFSFGVLFLSLMLMNVLYFAYGRRQLQADFVKNINKYKNFKGKNYVPYRKWQVVEDLKFVYKGEYIDLSEPENIFFNFYKKDGFYFFVQKLPDGKWYIHDATEFINTIKSLIL